VTGTVFTDSAPGLTRAVYMVRALKLEQSASGTYYNLSPGVIDSVAVSSGVAVRSNAAALPLGLRVSGRVVRISGRAGVAAAVSVLDMEGRLVRRVVLPSADRHGHTVDLARLPAGAYVVRVETDGGTLSRNVALW
jgi:hypothetical protein